MPAPADPYRPAQLATIKAISDRAQAVWYALLGVFLYLAVTAASTRTADFFAGERQITLPLVSVSVPSATFFLVAPVLAAVLYAHFHLFQMRLWQTLGQTEAVGEGSALVTEVPPWQLTAAALSVRGWLRNETSLRSDALGGLAAVVALLSAWAFAPVALGYVWWTALMSRDKWVVALSSLALVVTLTIGLASFALFWRAMSAYGASVRAAPRYTGSSWPGWVAATLVIGGLTVTAGENVALLRPLDLGGTLKVLRPKDWLAESYAFKEFQAKWCLRETGKNSGCKADGAALLEEWNDRKQSDMAFSDLGKLNEFMDKVDLSASDLSRTNLSWVAPAGSILFNGTNLYLADLRYAILFDPSFSKALLFRADISNASLTRPDFSGALISGDKFPCIIGADLTTGIQCGSGATSFLFELIDGVGGSKPNGGIRSDFLGSPLGVSTILKGARIANAETDGTALRFLDTEAFLDSTGDTAFSSFKGRSNAFADGTVSLSSGFDDRPCHWSDSILSDVQFFGLWRGFLMATGKAKWPPSDAIGDLEVANNRYEISDDYVRVVPHRIRVRSIAPIAFPHCATQTPVPCLNGVEDIRTDESAPRTCSAPS